MKTKIILLSTVLAVCNFQCSLWPDCDSKGVKPYFDAKGMHSPYIQVQSPASWNTYESVKLVALNSKLWFDVQFDASYYSSIPKQSTFSIVSSAYACSPPEAGYKGSSEKYKSISIVSNSDFDNNHLQGAELNDLFVIPENGGPDNISIKDYITANPRLVSPGLRFKLDKHPEIAKKHTFTFTVELTNGEVYKFGSGEIEFQ